MPELILRAASRDDAAFLLDLEEACMRAYAVALWGSSWRPHASAEAFDPVGHRIVVKAGIDVGCIAVAHHADHLWIDKLYVLPEYQHRGIGAFALRTVVAEAKAAGLSVRLSVLVTNPARRFYEREGFVLENETSERYLMLRDARR